MSFNTSKRFHLSTFKQREQLPERGCHLNPTYRSFVSHHSKTSDALHACARGHLPQADRGALRDLLGLGHSLMQGQGGGGGQQHARTARVHRQAHVRKQRAVRAQRHLVRSSFLVHGFEHLVGHLTFVDVPDTQGRCQNEGVPRGLRGGASPVAGPPRQRHRMRACTRASKAVVG